MTPARLPPRPRLRLRGVLLQAGAGLAILLFLSWLAHNATDALARRNMDLDWSFLLRPAGFDIPFRLTGWDTGDSYLAALGVAGLNTLLAAALAIMGATAGGVAVALLRLSRNPLARATSRGYTELVRNTPQLLQIIFWYIVVLQALPPPRASLSPLPGVFLNVRGLLLPAPVSAWFPLVLFLGLVLLVVPGFVLPPERRWWLRAPGVLLLASGLAASQYSWPALRGFNFDGGWRLPPELLALSAGIAIYTSAFLAENVRASIAGVAWGQTEAARSLGLSGARTMRLVILPQALRTLLPPLTNHYVNIVKSTTLGAAIAYPEILQIFARTVLNQSGRAVEVMTIVLGVYLVINLSVAGAMNRWDRRLRQQGR